jgi:hypothetical protein
MKWKTYLMGAAANERMERMGQSAHLSHACEILPGGALRPLCSVKLTSLCLDDSLTAEGELPDCPTCKRAIERAKSRVEPSPVPPEIVAAFEFGFRCCEKGYNLQHAITELHRVHTGQNAHPHGRWTPTKK